jgi:glycosyltransferase involved in cell wall biosynthesis
VKVLVVTNMYPTPGMPAFGTFVQDQVRALRGAGTDVDVFFVNGRASRWNYLWGIFRFWWLLWTHRSPGRRYDLIHAHYILSGVLARLQWGYRVVLTHHGPEVLGHPRWQAWLCRVATPLFDEVIYVSDEIRRALNDSRGWLIPCGIDLATFAPAPRAAARAALGLPPDRPLVLWAGEYWRPEKCFALVEQAMERVVAALPGAELVLLTKKPHDVVPSYMNACDALVLTSAAEGSPMVVKEAMACNLPVVSVRVGDVPEVIGATEGCSLAERDPDDIAARLVEVLRRRERTNGRDSVAPLGHDQIAARVQAVYARAVAPRRSLENRRGAGDPAGGAGGAGRAAGAGAPRGAVCIVRHAYYPDGHVRRDAETLAAAGYEVHVVALRRPGQAQRETLDGVAVHRMPVTHRRGGALRYAWEYAQFFVRAFATVSWLQLRRRLSVVEVDNMPDALVFTAALPKLMGTPVLLYIFDNMPELLAVTRGVSPRHPLFRALAALELASARFATRVIVTQEVARQIVVRRGVPQHKVSVVLNCPDEKVFAMVPPRALPASRPGVPAITRDGRDGARSEAESFELVTHGAVLHRYGIQVLIDALPIVASQVPGVRLQVFGEGEHLDALRAQAERLRVADRVRFRGLVPLDELLENLAAAHVGFVGMLCDNMLSNKLMEYVALGVPVVASRWPTYQHYFPEDSLAYYTPGNAQEAAAMIVSVYREPERAYRRALRAAELYRRYRWTTQRQVYLGIYESVLGRPATGPATVPVQAPAGDVAAPAAAAPELSMPAPHAAHAADAADTPQAQPPGPAHFGAPVAATVGSAA